MTRVAHRFKLQAGAGDVFPAILCALVLLLWGCDKGTTDPVRPSTEPAGAAEAHYNSDKSQLPVVFAAVAPATKPSGPLPSNASCVTPECHGEFTRAAQIHGPVAQRACDACHAGDMGGHTYPLKRDAAQTCTMCHSVAGMQSHQHKALEQGCLACHQPHTSRAKFLLKADTVERTCAACHEIPLKKFAHEPFIKGECTLCHQPHEADNKMLLRGGGGSKHCFTCHDGLRTVMASASHVHEPAVKDCNTCHEPHSTDQPRQLRVAMEQNCYACHNKVKKHVEQSNVQHKAMMEANKCANCHNAHASEQPGLLRQRMDKVCLSCHEQMGKTIASSQFLHGPIRAGSCGGCHDPHGSTFPNLLERSFPKSFYTSFDMKKYGLCFTCHEPQMLLVEKTDSLTNFRDGDRNLHFVHVNRDDKGRTCKTCHAVHGSKLPNHMASEVPFEGSNWAMPIEFEKKTDGGSCSPGCHVPKTYSWATSTTAPTTRGVE
jgi:predicted CXXCH cytochrome family protein